MYARVVDAVGPEARLPMPPQGHWDIFPWEIVDGTIAPKALRPPTDEPVRRGEGDRPCDECARVDSDDVIWEDESWILAHRGQPSGLPIVLLLHPREHEDMGQLDDDLASEYGQICNRLVRIMEHLPNVARVHVERWGDGGAHMHVWFFARTHRLAGVLGSAAPEWDGILPPVPEDVWRTDLHTVATKLANWGGKARV